MDTVTPPRYPHAPPSAPCVHFLLSLDEARDALTLSLAPLSLKVEASDLAKTFLCLAVNAVLAKESIDEGQDADDYFQALVLSLQDIGFSKQTAHETAQSAFDLVAKVVVENIPDFGDERYRGKYEYTLRTADELHLSVHQSAFGVYRFRAR